jgi:uncharacterized protein
MAHMSSNDRAAGPLTEGWLDLTPEQRQMLVDLAASAIRHEIERGRPPAVDPRDYPEPLRVEAATFVTLEREGRLVGCIGTLEPRESLVESVASNACAAAFRDPRDLGPRPRTTDGLDIHISILSPMEPMQFDSEEDLLRQIRPGVDGLLLEDGFHRGTFLPSVWDQLPDPSDFLAHLKTKAGLPPGYWSSSIRVFRYTAQSVP